MLPCAPCAATPPDPPLQSPETFAEASYISSSAPPLLRPERTLPAPSRPAEAGGEKRMGMMCVPPLLAPLLAERIEAPSAKGLLA